MAKPNSVDRAFVRYQRTGHPAWLAAVFDATAAELLQLAWHLSGDREAAEDLVQSTFLTAIEQRARFDANEPVMPWLCGILAHRARVLRRSRAIAARHAERLPSRDDVHDAVADAAAGELRAEVLAALRNLPEPYRQVLLLHLQHGLDGPAIADTLQRPAATVRSQIHRGLAMLRKALPIGIASAASAMAPTPAVLASVRHAVLAGASPGVPAAASWLPWVLAFLTMHKPALTVAAGIASLSLLAIALWPQTNAPAPRTAGERTPALVAGERSAALSPADTGATQEVSRSAAAARVTSLVVTVQRPDGRPLADVGVHWVPMVARSELAVLETRSDAAGRARFVGLPAGKAVVRSDRGGNTTVDVLDGEVHEITLQLPGTRTVHGLVVDPNERPVPEAEVWLLSQFQGGARLATTAPDGSFTVESVPNDHGLAAWARGGSQSQPQWLTEKQPDPWPCRLVVHDCGGDLSGTVLDRSGQPVPGAVLQLDTPRPTDHEGHPWATGACDRQVRTDANGSFRFLGAARGQRMLWCAASGYAASVVRVEHADGPTETTVILTAGATVRGSVHHEDGTPAAGLWVQQLPPDSPRYVPWTPTPRWAHGEVTVASDGGFTLSCLSPGPIDLRVRRQDQRECSIQLQLADGETGTWHARFGDAPVIQGVVADADARPLPGWRVRVATAARLAEATTDAQGSFRLDLPDRPHDLEVLSPIQHVALRKPGVRPSPEILRLVVPDHELPSAVLTGTLNTPDGTPLDMATVQLTWCREDGALVLRGTEPMQGHRFRSGLLCPGHYQVHASGNRLGTLLAGPFRVTRGETLDVGALQFAPPGRLRVRTICGDGAPSAAKGGLLVRATTERQGWMVESRDGRADLGLLQPGVYFVSTWSEDAATLQATVQPGDDLDLVLTIPVGVPCVVRFPAIPCADHVLRHTWRDERGEVAFESFGSNDPCPTFDLPLRIAPGRYAISVTDGADRTATTTAEVRAGGAPNVIVLPLPGEPRK